MSMKMKQLGWLRLGTRAPSLRSSMLSDMKVVRVCLALWPCSMQRLICSLQNQMPLNAWIFEYFATSMLWMVSSGPRFSIQRIATFSRLDCFDADATMLIQYNLEVVWNFCVSWQALGYTASSLLVSNLVWPCMTLVKGSPLISNHFGEDSHPVWYALHRSMAVQASSPAWRICWRLVRRDVRCNDSTDLSPVLPGVAMWWCARHLPLCHRKTKGQGGYEQKHKWSAQHCDRLLIFVIQYQLFNY